MAIDGIETSKVALIGVSKYFDEDTSHLAVFEDLSVSFLPGNITVILGPSGCGKSTMLSLLAGLESPSLGRIESPLPNLHQTGYVFQRDRLLSWRTALENAVLGLELLGEGGQGAKRRAVEMLTSLGLEEFLHAYPETLSEGMRQRVAVCRALLIQPRLLLLDEPLGSLDFKARLTVEDMIRSFTRSTQATTVVVTHDLDEAVAMADELILLTPRPARIEGSWSLSFGKNARDGRTVRETDEFKAFLADLISRVLSTHGK